MNWWIVGLLAAIVAFLWQIAASLLPVGEYFKYRNAKLEQDAQDAEFESIRNGAVDDDG